MSDESLRISYTTWIRQEDDTEKEITKHFSISAKRVEKIRLKKNELFETFRNNNMVLCVSSGVTAKYVGTWFELIGKLISDRFVDWSMHEDSSAEKRNFFRSITVSSKHGISATELGQYLLLDERDHCSSISNPLYAEEWKELYLATQIQSHMPDIQVCTKKATCECDPSKNTFDALLTLCSCKKNNNEYAFKHIVNYNYDTLLERCLKDQDYKQALCSKNIGRELHFAPEMKVIISPEENASFEGYEDQPEIRRLYHVHGCLEKNGTPNPVIFSESSYDDLSKKHYQWCNQVQAELCLRFPLLFVGFSGNDPNFRRLLKEMSLGHSKRKESFLFMRLSDVREIIQLKPTSNSQPQNKDTWINEAVDMLLESIEYYYKQTYNICVLWYQDYEEIAQTLLELADICKQNP